MATRPAAAFRHATSVDDAQYVEHVLSVRPGTVGKLAPGEGESATDVAMRLARAAINADRVVDPWIVDGVVYFTVRECEPAGAEGDSEDPELAAIALFRSEQIARRWLRRRNAGLGGERPVDLLGTSDGRRAVRDLIGRIEHGIAS